MFKFDGCIDRGAFLRAAAIRLGLFVASLLAFPLFLMAVASVSGCARVGGACGAVGLVGSMAFKPLAFVLFVFSWIGISIRRARDVGVPGSVGLLAPLLFAADYAFLIYAGAPWTLGFSAGILFQTFPRAALLGLYCIAILCVMPSRHHRDAIANPFGMIGLVAFGLGLLVALNVTMGLVVSFAGFQPWTLMLMRLLRSVGQATPYAMIGFAAALTLIAWQYRNPSDDMAGPSTPPRVTPKFVPPPIGWLLALALVSALIACAVSLDKESSASIPLFLVVNLSSTVLPTVAIYFFLLFGLWLIAVRRTAGSLVALPLALLPFLHWGYAHWTATKDHEIEAAEIAAVRTKVLPRLPTTIVFESRHLEGLRGSWKLPAIDRVIAKGAYGSTLIQFDRNTPRDRAAKQSAVTSLPDEYLLLRVGQSSGFAKPRQIYAATGGPLELRYVDASHDDLVAIWYHAFNPGPTILPILTTSGWYRGPNSASTGDVDLRVGEFLATATRTPI